MKSKTQNNNIGVSTIIAVLALTISVVSAYLSHSSSQDSARVAEIEKQYETFMGLNKFQVENWHTSHIFALPESYDEVSKQVVASFDNVSQAKRAELLLKERWTSLYIFTMFEQSLYQWDQAKKAGDTKRKEFLEAVLNYYTGRLLRNPRLLYYWADDGGKLNIYFEEDTRSYYQEHVQPEKQRVDREGPFGANHDEPRSDSQSQTK